MNRFLLYGILAVAFCIGASGLRAQILLNGSFEDPALPAGGNARGSGSNWTAPTNGGVYVETNGFGLGITPYGNQYVYLDRTFSDAQTVAGPSFTLGRTYTLSLMAADVFGNDGDQLTVVLSGGVVVTQTFAVPIRSAGVGNTPLVFVNCSLTFTPTSAAAVMVTLTNSSRGGALILDNVQLVPEPSTWAMLGLGVVSAGVMALCRRQTA